MKSTHPTPRPISRPVKSMRGFFWSRRMDGDELIYNLSHSDGKTFHCIVLLFESDYYTREIIAMQLRDARKSLKQAVHQHQKEKTNEQ